MQQLHLVGFTTELDGLIFSARKGSKSGSFVVKIDGGLLSTLEDVRRIRAGDSPSDDTAGSRSGSSATRRPRPESTLSPREIQSRLRSGATIREVAATAGVDEEWVSRFAAPILAEQQQVVMRARNLIFAKARLGDSAYPLGASVLLNLADRGIRLTEDAFESGWRGWNVHGAVWIVQFAYRSRQRSQAAEWEVDLREGILHNRNRLAADLGHVEPGRRRRSVPQFEPPEPDAADVPASGARKSAAAPSKAKGAAKTGGRAGKKAASSKKAAAKKATAKKKAAARKAGATRAPAKKAAAKKTTAKNASAKNASAKKASAKKATAQRVSAKRATAKRATANRAPSKRPAARKAAAGRAPAKKTPAAGPPPRQPAVSPLEERVSHLARPASPPTRRGAARDGTPVISPRGSTSRSTAEPSRTDRPRRPSGPSAPPAAAPARLERMRGRPAEPTADERTRGSRSATSSATSSPTPSAPRLSASAERAQSSREPVRIPARPAPPPPRPAPAPRPPSGSPPSGGSPAAAPAPRVSERPRPPTPAPEPAPSRPTRTAARPAETPPPPDRLARRFARRSAPAASNGGPTHGTTATANGGAGAGASPARADEPIWHGPDSGEPAPPMRIRADLAAAASARNDEATRVRRSAGRDRPLRAR